MANIMKVCTLAPFKLNRNGREDKVSLPAGFVSSPDDVIIREGDRLIVEPEAARNR